MPVRFIGRQAGIAILRHTAPFWGSTHTDQNSNRLPCHLTGSLKGVIRELTKSSAGNSPVPKTSKTPIFYYCQLYHTALQKSTASCRFYILYIFSCQCRKSFDKFAKHIKLISLHFWQCFHSCEHYNSS